MSDIPLADHDAANLRIDAGAVLLKWEACDYPKMGKLMSVLVGEAYTDYSWSDEELNIYRALIGPHGRTIFKALVAKRGINLDDYK